VAESSSPEFLEMPYWIGIPLAIVALILFDVAAYYWGVDSRGFGRDPRDEDRPQRWI
jgi:hypothetical protein